MGDLTVHANEVRNCKACYARIVLLKNTYNKYSAFNVPDTERGSWLTADDRDFHDCPKKEWLELLKGKTRRQ
jgi:hypothetical protein